MNKLNKILICIAILLYIAGTANAIPVEKWNKTFGGNNNDVGNSIQQTTDGGYIIAGVTAYSSGVSSENIYLVKTGILGNKLWEKTFGGSKGDWGESVQQTSDGGYIIVGGTDSYGAGSTDVYLIKTDASGNKLWERTFGGSGYDVGTSVQQIAGGGYIIVGETYSYGSGNNDVYLIKTDASGHKLWDKTFGGSGYDMGRSVQQTPNGEYIIAGSTDSYGGGFTNVYLVKVDYSGNKLWDKTFGGDGNDNGESVMRTVDGGYIIIGETWSYSNGYTDVYMIKTDSSGRELWSKTFGGNAYEWGNSVKQTLDRGYIIAGSTQSYGSGHEDLYLIKTDASGNKLWDKTLGGSGSDMGRSVQQTTDGGYIIAGGTDSYGANKWNMWLIKISDIASANLLKNPGFEIVSGSLPQYWTKTQTGTIATFTYPVTGRVGGKAVAIRYATKEIGKVALWQQTGIPVIPSKQYKLSGYMKLEGVTGGGTLPRYNGAGIRINWYTSANVLIRADVITKSGTIGWAKYEKTFTAPSNAAKATVGGDLYNSAGKVTFDDLSLTKVS